MAMNRRNNAFVHGCEYSLVVDKRRDSIPDGYEGLHPGHYLIFGVDFLISDPPITVQNEYTFSLNLQSITSLREELHPEMCEWINEMSQRSIPQYVTNYSAKEITSMAVELADDHDFAVDRILQLYLKMVVHYNPIELGRAMRESGPEARVARRTVPATKSSIEALEEVNLETDCCVICLEKLCHEDHQKVLLRMPCSHIYHKTCIVRWLETSYLCPTCRYAVPHDRCIPMPHDEYNRHIPMPRDQFNRRIPVPHDEFNRRIPMPHNEFNRPIPIPHDVFNRCIIIPIPHDVFNRRIPMPHFELNHPIPMPHDQFIPRMPVPHISMPYNEIIYNTPMPHDEFNRQTPAP